MLKYEQREHGLYAVVYDDDTGDFFGEVVQIPFKIKCRTKYNLTVARICSFLMDNLDKLNIKNSLFQFIHDYLIYFIAKNLHEFKDNLSVHYGLTQEQALAHVRKMLLGG